jgi:hypothetical protein
VGDSAARSFRQSLVGSQRKHPASPASKALAALQQKLTWLESLRRRAACEVRLRGENEKKQ